MPNKNLKRNKNGSWESTTEILPSEKEQRNKVVKATDFIEKTTKKRSKTTKTAD